MQSPFALHDRIGQPSWTPLPVGKPFLVAGERPSLLLHTGDVVWRSGRVPRGACRERTATDVRSLLELPDGAGGLLGRHCDAYSAVAGDATVLRCLVRDAPASLLWAQRLVRDGVLQIGRYGVPVTWGDCVAARGIVRVTLRHAPAEYLLEGMVGSVLAAAGYGGVRVLAQWLAPGPDRKSVV